MNKYPLIVRIAQNEEFLHKLNFRRSKNKLLGILRSLNNDNIVQLLILFCNRSLINIASLLFKFFYKLYLYFFCKQIGINKNAYDIFACNSDIYLIILVIYDYIIIYLTKSYKKILMYFFIIIEKYFSNYFTNFIL